MSRAPSHQVASRVLFENDRVRVWEMTLEPGASSARHVHENDYLFVYLSSTTLELDEDGDTSRSKLPVGHVEYREVGAGVTHRVKNVGRTAHREILVELKGGSRSRRAKEPETSGG